MAQRPDTADYRALFLSDAPLLDVRAPKEFSQGAFPNASSLPLLSDDERAQVGICYKQRGQAAAIELGHALVSGELRCARLAQWLAFTRQHPNGYLYCFRGGLRSRTVQQWLREAGVDYPRIAGGYKAMRRFLLEELERSVRGASLVLVSGRTGTGKTRVIARLARSVDLEGLARHRGSSFGQLPQPQPAQIDFENSISIVLMQLLARGDGPLFVEDEGRLIGRLFLPEVLRRKMQSAPMLVVEQSLAERVDVVIDDYIVDLGRRYAALYGAAGPQRHAQKMLEDLARIRKRLGTERYREVSAAMASAFEEQRRSGSLARHRQWVAALLRHYYDPMYDYQLSRRGGACLFRGDRDAVVAWAQGAR
ncbi:MAG: tRNA 2-selenouridine(34) synthase MnmH [Halioglobus sp.]|nr:tRNA 2-selenouridine(34) synthase MnmH [Halioglobus sp.]